MYQGTVLGIKCKIHIIILYLLATLLSVSTATMPREGTGNSYIAGGCIKLVQPLVAIGHYLSKSTFSLTQQIHLKVFIHKYSQCTK